MDGFSADQWSKLTNGEWLEYCRVAAREAEAYAKSASPDTRELHESLAERWRLLAAEIERH